MPHLIHCHRTKASNSHRATTVTYHPIGSVDAHCCIIQKIIVHADFSEAETVYSPVSYIHPPPFSLLFSYLRDAALNSAASQVCWSIFVSVKPQTFFLIFMVLPQNSYKDVSMRCTRCSIGCPQMLHKNIRIFLFQTNGLLSPILSLQIRQKEIQFLVRQQIPKA